MDVIVDTSALIAVILNEPAKKAIVAATKGCTLAGPPTIPWEVGNAFSAALKKGRLRLETAQRAFRAFQRIPIRSLDVNIEAALSISARYSIYAYDAYFLECASRYGMPFLTLDRRLRKTAGNLNIGLVEIGQ